MIPCVVYATDPETGVRVAVGYTRTYRGAKRLIRRVQVHCPYPLRPVEAWHWPTLCYYPAGRTSK